MVRLAPWNWFKTSGKICLLTIPRRYFYCGYLCFCGVVFSRFGICIMLSCGHLLGKCWPLGSCWWCLLYFCYFPMWYPVSGVVLNCIVSWSSLSSSVLGRFWAWITSRFIWQTSWCLLFTISTEMCLYLDYSLFQKMDLFVSKKAQTPFKSIEHSNLIQKGWNYKGLVLWIEYFIVNQTLI